MIPYGRQDISQADIDAVVEVLKGDFLTQGPWVEKFEKSIADYCGVKYAVAVASATAALHIVYAALGMKPGKLVWTVPNTFVATANAALYCGADIDFVDISPTHLVMCPVALKKKLEEAKAKGRLPDLVVPVQFSGACANMQAIRKLADEYGFKIVEDAAHCIGASYNGKKVGSCEFSDAAVFSFHPVKIITTGEGGLVATNDEDVYKALMRLRTHGITRDEKQMTHNEGGWYFEQLDLGYHYRITDMQCALGVSQMTRLDPFVKRRNELAARYNTKLHNLAVKPIEVSNDSHSSWHLYVVMLDKKYDRRKVYDTMRAKGVGVNVHYIPVHLHPYYAQFGFKKGDFPVSEEYYDRALTLPLYSGLTEQEQDHVCQSLAESLSEDNEAR